MKVNPTSHSHPMMVLEDYVKQVREIRRERRMRINAISTRKEALKYREHVRQVIENAFIPRPRKTPLNPRSTHSFETREFRVENIHFESRPGCLVTANLYIPKGCD